MGRKYELSAARPVTLARNALGRATARRGWRDAAPWMRGVGERAVEILAGQRDGSQVVIDFADRWGGKKGRS
jgi:hypothetical protein